MRGSKCSLITDKGSCLNLIGKQFVRNVLQIKSEDDLPSRVRIKGISGQVLTVVKEIKLKFSALGETFKVPVIFLVIHIMVCFLLL